MNFECEAFGLKGRSSGSIFGQVNALHGNWPRYTLLNTIDIHCVKSVKNSRYTVSRYPSYFRYTLCEDIPPIVDTHCVKISFLL